MKGDFVSNLGKVYGIYTGGFVAFVVLLAILEQIGVPNQIIGYLFVFFTIAVYAGIGFLSRTAQVSEYYVAGRKVPALYNGMATAADWMSAASFIGMAGSLYAQGYDGLAFVLGWTGGYVLVATLIAPYLRKFGAFTVPDFLGSRYGGDAARFCGIVVLFCCSFTYIVAQVFGTGLIASRFLGIGFETAVYVGLAGILLCSMLGGMRAVTWTQVAQYIVLIVAYLVPVVILSTQITGVPVPQIMQGQIIQEITALELQHGGAGGYLEGVKAHATPFLQMNMLNFFALIVCLMIGTASLPHVLMRYFTTPSVREARKSVAWSLLFIFILYFTAPAYAAFAKFEIYSNVLGKDVSTLQAVTSLPEWVFIYGKLGLLKLCGVTNFATPDELFAACQAGAQSVLTLSKFSIDSNALVIATPEIAGLPYVIAGLVAAGGLAAALSTADGLLLAIANALSHDIYYRMIDPRASTKQRLVVARALLVVVAIAAAYVASTKPSGILAMVSWAFSLAAAGLFPALVLGVWWKRTTSAGAVIGMIAGFGVTTFYLVMTRYFPVEFIDMFGTASEAGMAKIAELQAALAAATGDAVTAAEAALSTEAQKHARWFGISNISAGIFGLPVGFVVMIVVSYLTPAPSKEMQDFIDSVRVPKGGTVMKEADAKA
jgi:cation/acetate symporter